jgi:hypothetical protein
MSQQDAVETLKQLPKGRKWSTRQALDILCDLEKGSFRRLTDYAEAVTAAMIGQRWEAVAGKQGYDTVNTLARWLGPAARQYGDPEILLDVKTQKEGIGYSEKTTERANKASDYLDRRLAGRAVLNGVVFHTTYGMFFQLGLDHEGTKPQFGSAKRPIVGPKDLAAAVDGEGGILPAVMLTSIITWNGADFDHLGVEGIQEANRNLTKILRTILEEVGMEKVQKHLDGQADKAVEQATDRMLKNERTGKIVAKRVARNKAAIKAVVAEAPEAVATESLLALGYSREEAEAIVAKKKK